MVFKLLLVTQEYLKSCLSMNLNHFAIPIEILMVEILFSIISKEIRLPFFVDIPPVFFIERTEE